ncbi:helix-turn-helix domain-containing protein [Pusillimonas sp. MFBS29]|uniref:TniQ family protein n=1 Tax=Pusillimonas sp. MFBS29 TaxID=2886690 RepID=UPI001D0FFE67|nr:helix-turn-helix domain-containing protein [Pusillimonas sp. MFBS29]MCC2597465.1 helix-turn-helix domain-containing protein [Pusillimonas sp. MFBS29]
MSSISAISAAATLGLSASTPRSTLHALPPIGLGTSEVESLTSYFCRLANSHACTTNDLAKFIIERIEPGRWETHQGTPGKSRFVWYQRSISGVGDSALNWAGMLSALTGVATLQQLTLLPLQGCVAAKGLMATRARWCPYCLADDQREGQQPYFRLAWDIGLNKVCVRHLTALIARCPHCNASNVRHTANVVVPGWCTACGCFLGSAIPLDPTIPPATEQKLEIEQARCITDLLAAMSTSPETGPAFTPDIESFHQGVERLIGDMDGGLAAHFARRLGVRKSTVHYWRTVRTPLTLEALVRIAMHCGVSLANLLQGTLADWCPPPTTQQLALQLGYPLPNQHRPKRQHDWGAIRQRLRDELKQTEPRSVTEVAKALDIDVRHLYIQATTEARTLGACYVQHLHQRALQAQTAIYAELLQACEILRENGESITVEQVAQLVEPRTLNSTRHLYTVLSSLAGQAANDAAM